ncbi:Oil body-associated protein 1B, partial [Penicillium pulvis]|uniref:Oil body-associated protein 1B n=1 Tax=Penicillium pulvis TaxID=1562058 RepID=UPI0025497F0A
GISQDQVFETGTALVQGFTPIKQNVFSHSMSTPATQNSAPRRVITAHIQHPLHERPGHFNFYACHDLIHDSPDIKVHLLGSNYKASPRIRKKVPCDERKLWNHRELEARRGILRTRHERRQKLLMKDIGTIYGRRNVSDRLTREMRCPRNQHSPGGFHDARER